MRNILVLILICCSLNSCKNIKPISSKTSLETKPHFDWQAANVYFLLTDRFANGDTSNDNLVKRDKETGTLRGFEGGDFAGIEQRIEDGYFTDLGVNAIWLTPIFEQIHDGVDEGTGFTYAYHGYWAKDWTAVEPAYGTIGEFKNLVQLAHSKGIRILLDVVINHTGPVTQMDPQWPESWVRTGPTCSYQDQESAVSCTLTNNLPDIRTDSKEEVDLPEILVNKWKAEGRYEQEVKELNLFFETSKLPRTPANYLIKWVTDYARETGVDGFRVDTVKHVEESVWATFNEQAKLAFNEWKENNPEKKIHDDEFFIMGELYGYSAASGRGYDFGDAVVDYFDFGYDAMINFSFKSDAQSDYKTLFKKYDQIRSNLLSEKEDTAVFVNYISSHDDGQPFDPAREKMMESGSKLLLTPGISQIYYGDETARSLEAENANGDANLRTNMNWDNVDQGTLAHWQKLGRFRRDHPAVGAGEVLPSNYKGSGSVTTRSYSKDGYSDKVIIGAGLPNGLLTLNVSETFKNRMQLRNYYTGERVAMKNGMVQIQVENGIILLESINE
ncbi:alpha-amylase family glycosyl hydrolase [Nonlabens antarcticus]|uniref:alpha-amylase family glycosyl hydrolase n=1 Tax=Nonlabens antarcticus TaxID=392714 RepID=UPI001890DDB0|nr:alpha-amylase family glycosyl hydrolase [Nonlabens antarcticus]